MAIYLLGVDHRDRENGPKKLEEALNKIKPNMLFYEDSETQHTEKNQYACWRSQSAIKKRGMSDFEKEALKSLEAMILPWSQDVIDQYSQDHNVQREYGHRSYNPEVTSEIAIVEASSVFFSHDFFKDGAREITSAIHDAKLHSIQEDSYDTPSKEDLSSDWSKYVSDERSLISEWDLFWNGAGRGDSKDMENAIRGKYDPNKTAVYPVEMIHLIDSIFGQTLYSRIKDLEPKRIPLI